MTLCHTCGEIHRSLNLSLSTTTKRSQLLCRSRRPFAICDCKTEYGVYGLMHRQVAVMKRIYAKARTVRVWIDVNLSPDDGAVRKLLSLSSRSTMDDLGNDPVFWEPLIPLFQSLYWDRLWIQQELLFAKRLEFHCHGVNIPGNNLMKFQHFVFQKSSLGRGPFDPLSDWATFGKQPPAELQFDPNKWGPAFSASPIYMLGALRHVRDLKVTEPKDRVHATLGLIIDYEGANEVWSYEESLTDKYTRIAWLLILKCNSLRFLADVKLTEKPDPTVIGLPSWVPNWNPPGNAAFFHASFRAAGDIPMFPYPLGEHMEERILNARGFQYDSVRQTLGTRDNSRIPLSQLFTFSISALGSCADLSRYFDDLASALTEPSLAKLQLSQSYFRQTEKIFYLYVLHHYAFATPGLRIADILPYEAIVYSQSREDWAGSIENLQSFHDLLPSDLRTLDLKKLSDVIPQSLDQYQRFGHFITLISQTLGSGCLMSSTSFHLGITERMAAVKAGDEVWILFGCPIPMILRRDGSAYVVVCPTYVCNIMDGRAVEGIYSPDQFNMWPKVFRTGYFAKPSIHKNSYVSGNGKVYVKVIKLR
ncbi:uncharacterized protein FOBCDRAFT_139600 [Fusarium oxysporum Fo47]|uniref:uncharacterized protein n=1 Tax=Fusarium oxysporum Fo47 TaxID=660027 RepID=UPI002869CB84|nr:uncharacterized protein FOBCDRAFT_139600 [Fusarium oxysporum Fo47]QKD57099.2 hypothetical protein FOBCDRAFT_139600 [Fusarium oxysporum Fo47]